MKTSILIVINSSLNLLLQEKEEIAATGARKG